MARGYPDFFSMPIFPSRGIFRAETDSIACPTAATTPILTINSKSNLVSLVINYLCISNHITDIIKVSVDGATLIELMFENLMLFGNGVDIWAIAKMVCVDQTQHNYCVSFNPGIEWGALLEISIQNVGADDGEANYSLAYYDVI